MTCMTVAVVVAVAVVAMVTRAHRESYLRSGSAGCGAARGGAGQRGEAVRRGGAARCGEAVRRRDLEADVLALSVACAGYVRGASMVAGCTAGGYRARGRRASSRLKVSSSRRRRRR